MEVSVRYESQVSLSLKVWFLFSSSCGVSCSELITLLSHSVLVEGWDTCSGGSEGVRWCGDE